ncbi:MAG TPA: cytochrome c oxidase assembly protein [Caulobacteraceae bacterium]|nr:cytochrome c oxidase assembly protein [Caulobacteraceae bacterium]
MQTSQWRAVQCAALAAAILAPTVALADDAGGRRPLWLAWDFSADLVIPAAAALLLYWRGLERRPGAFDATPARHLAFMGGVFLTFAALASPIDAMSDHLFSMHQVQHMLLRVVGPMLIAYAQPGATLVAGSPNWLRRGPVTRLLTSYPNRGLFRFLTRPWAATALFVASLYAWQWPPFHNRAIIDDGVHYLMHITMLAAGLLFFWVVFDQRPPPKGGGYGARLMMVWIGTLANIPIGAFTCLKSQELYPAYDTVGRLFGVSAMDDERLGGFIMWAPCSMMMLIALLLVVHAWGSHEEKVVARREALAAAPRNNGALAVGLLGFAACVLCATLAIGVIANQWTRAGSHAFPARAVALAARVP